MSLEIKCVWCSGPLVDVDHAKAHVRKCAQAPWTAAIREAAAIMCEARLLLRPGVTFGDPEAVIDRINTFLKENPCP